jgi:hypothetical protein
VTFRQSLNAFGDRALAGLIGSVDAGACVVENGQFCACLSQVNTCWSSHIPPDKTKYIYSCNGACVPQHGPICC